MLLLLLSVALAADPHITRMARGFLSIWAIEEDGHVASGEPKHWHVFHVVARKR